MCWAIGDKSCWWAVGDKIKTRLPVCKMAFCNVYRVSSSHVDNVVREIKDGVANSLRPLSDRTKTPDYMLQDLRRIGRSFGLHLTRKQVAAAKLPNSPTVLAAYGWMAAHFQLVGDQAPNADGEIHRAH